MRNKKMLTVLFVLLAVLVSVSAMATTRLRLATTTSLYDTGLWEYLEQIFEERYEIDLHVIYAGTGRALTWGRRGDVDIVVIHSPPDEKEFVAGGYGVERVPFAYNYFLIVGPADDPAGIAGLSPQDAFRRLVEFGEGRFVSRGDDSGTHAMEKLIWEKAGLDHEAVRPAAWYMEAGQGMGPTLIMASEERAYTLTDMGTFLAFRGKLDLVPLVVEGEILLNVYSAIAIDPRRHPHTNLALANKMIAFLISPEIQERIGAFGVEEHGMQLFTPCAGATPCVEIEEEAQR